ncbi:MAG: cell division FtsA domain-containing protein, partial [Candidatus Cybelea sp.]
LGSAIYTATIPVGGNVLTSDVSLGLKTTLAEAEDVKKRLGAGENGAVFSVRTLDGRATREHPTAELRQIIVPRVLETLRMARQKIVENVPRDLVLGEVVLTGGGALLPGIEPLAEEVFKLPVRVGTANSIGGLTDAMTMPQYSTAIGLVVFGTNGAGDDSSHVRRRSGLFPRIQRWLADLWT